MLTPCPMLSMVGLAAVADSSTYRPWEYLVLSLACAAVFLVSSRQDIGLGATTGVIFGQVMALFVLIAMTVKALLGQWWIEAVISTAAFCAELWLVKRWYFSGQPK